MNCHYCQQPLRRENNGTIFCSNHPFLVYHYFTDSKNCTGLIFVLLTTHVLYKKSTINIRIDEELDSIWVYYLMRSKNIKLDGLDTSVSEVITPVTLYKGKIPDNFSLENAIDFAVRISKLQTFS